MLKRAFIAGVLVLSMVGLAQAQIGPGASTHPTNIIALSTPGTYTYTPTPGMVKVDVYLVGGGAGGASSYAAGTSAIGPTAGVSGIGGLEMAAAATLYFLAVILPVSTVLAEQTSLPVNNSTMDTSKEIHLTIWELQQLENAAARTALADDDRRRIAPILAKLQAEINPKVSQDKVPQIAPNHPH